MRIHLLAVGTRMPDWVSAGYHEYSKRLPRECGLHLVELPAGRRGKGRSVEQARAEEGRQMLAAIPRDCLVVALDEHGSPWTTAQLAGRLQEWLGGGRDVALLVGGPDGLDASCRARADFTWSLSGLTFPHALVRVLLAEQLYRAWSLGTGHPYHRA